MAKQGWRGLLAAFAVCLTLLMPQRAQAEYAGKEEALLEALGSTAAITLYNSHLVLGMAADALGSGVYTETRTLQCINEQRNMLKILVAYVDKLLLTGEMSAADAETLTGINACSGKLIHLADALEIYAGDPNQKNAALFMARRDESYSAIAQLLGLAE